MDIDSGHLLAYMARIRAKRTYLVDATQACPLSISIDAVAAAAAFSRSASENMIKGDFPPNSKVTFLRLDSAAAFLIALPAIWDPVKEIFRMSMCLAIASPQGRPKPERILSTPLGTPASWHRRPIRSTDSGHFSLDLSTKVFPALSAGPTLLMKVIRVIFLRLSENRSVGIVA